MKRIGESIRTQRHAHDHFHGPEEHRQVAQDQLCLETGQEPGGGCYEAGPPERTWSLETKPRVCLWKVCCKNLRTNSQTCPRLANAAKNSMNDGGASQGLCFLPEQRSDQARPLKRTSINSLARKFAPRSPAWK